MRKQRSYEPISRLDLELNAILQNPDADQPTVGYDVLEKKVQVRVEAPELRAPIQGSTELGAGFYAAKVTMGYLKELAYREDILHIYAVTKSQKPLKIL